MQYLVLIPIPIPDDAKGPPPVAPSWDAAASKGVTDLASRQRRRQKTAERMAKAAAETREREAAERLPPPKESEPTEHFETTYDETGSARLVILEPYLRPL